MSSFKLSILYRWTSKKIFGLAFAASLMLGVPAAYGQDACTSIVGNLLASLNCGFNLGPSLPSANILQWSGVQPDGLNAWVLNSGTTITGPSVTLSAGDYLVSFKVRSASTTSQSATIGAVNLFGPATVTLASNLTVLAGNPISWTTGVSYLASIVNSGPYQIQFTGLLANTINIDSFSIVAVPEPATMMLLGSLCSAVAGYKYKKKEKLPL